MAAKVDRTGRKLLTTIDAVQDAMVEKYAILTKGALPV